MRILHYSLGLPPYRTGGLTKYSVDLMELQAKQGHMVSLLFPGHYSLFRKFVNIKRYKLFKDIEVYELVNPLPVPLLGGIESPKAFTVKVNKKVFIKYLKMVNPDVIHVHTLMGLYKEFVEAAKELHIKIYFTTHDYFGICPKVNLLRNDGTICNSYENGKACVSCNKGAYSIRIIHLMQSRVYRLIKEKELIKRLRRTKKSKYHSQLIKEMNINELEVTSSRSKEYVDLRSYYLEMLCSFDKIHFNSSVAKNIYNKYIKDIKGQVISISHSDIKDNRIKKLYIKDEKLKLTYIGPIEPYKGLFFLIKSLNDLITSGINNWELNIYGNDRDIADDAKNNHIKSHGRYDYNYQRKIFESTDVLVVPSLCKETFGLVVLEAISYGVPVLVTTNVGAKDLLEEGNGYIVEPTSNALSEIIKDLVLNRQILTSINNNICKGEFKLDMETHTKSMFNFYDL